MASGEVETIDTKDRAAWRRWLERNHRKASAVWLIRPKKGSARTSVSYDESVEEALCFGWIDAKTRSVDDEHYLHLFTPRRPRSEWSASNKKRVAALTRAGLITPAGLAAIETAKRNGSWNALDGVEALTMPEDLAASLAGNARAKRHFDAFSPSTRKGFLAWIAKAKRPETRAKRVAATVRLSARNIKIQDATPEDRRG
ncbi:MAG TPA: YdeI/OmpD-associated family protein [Actinomycetota bacterium]